MTIPMDVSASITTAKYRLTNEPAACGSLCLPAVSDWGSLKQDYYTTINQWKFSAYINWVEMWIFSLSPMSGRWAKSTNQKPFQLEITSAPCTEL